MVSNLALKLEADKTYTDWGSYNDGTTFDLIPVDSSSTTSSWYSCGTTSNGNCAFNGNTVMRENIANGGYYYSWYAATAGKGKSTNTGTDINGSICPRGWKLPYDYAIDNSKSYGGLLKAYGMPTTNVDTNYVSTLEIVPLSFYRVGCYAGGVLGGGAYGPYWTSTISGSGAAYNFDYSSSFTYPRLSRGMYFGFPVRCVAL